MMCPQPVLTVKRHLDDHADSGAVRVTVDNAPARENVSRFLETNGFRVSDAEVEGGWEISGVRDGAVVVEETGTGMESGGSRKILVLLANDRIGRGDHYLGTRLMTNFVNTLNEMGSELWRVVCLNEGVKLALEDAETLEGLETLSKRGIDILVCGTCLDHYGVLEKKAVGTTTNMLDVVTSLELADHIISM